MSSQNRSRPAYLEGADVEIIRQTVEQSLRTLPIADASDLVRFVGPLLLYLRDWLQVNTSRHFEDSDRSVFIFSEYTRQEGEKRGFVSVPLFREDRHHDLVGQLYMCHIDVTNVVRRDDLAGPDAPALVQQLSELILSNRPTVLFYPARRSAVLYSAGVDREDSRLEYNLNPPVPCATADELDELLSNFHFHCLRVPNEAVKVWDNAARYFPVDHAEKVIQNQLVLAIRLHVDRKCGVHSEWDVGTGRADIGILPPPAGPGDRCVLELKVLRSRYKGGRSCSYRENETAIVDGLDQAVEYRLRTTSQHAFLCCYDMRQDDDDAIVAGLQPLADQRQVQLRRYYLHNSARAARRNDPSSAHHQRHVIPASSGSVTPQG